MGTITLADGEVAVAYSQSIQVYGGTGKYSLSIVSGLLPAGLALDGNTGVVSGTPTADGKFHFVVQVNDSAGAIATQSLSVNINTVPVVTSTSLPNGENGIIYAQTLQASGGTEDFTWSLSSGALPDGLALTGSTGAIFGTATKTGTFNFKIQVNDGMGSSTQSLSITILTPVTLYTTSLPSGSLVYVYSQTLQAAGGGVPYTWSITKGALPDGLTLDENSGTISGTPKVAGSLYIYCPGDRCPIGRLGGEPIYHDQCRTLE